MSYTEEVTNLVIGDDFDWDILVSDVPSGQTVVSGWLTVKNYATDTTHIFQKRVGTTLSAAGLISISGVYTRVLITATYEDTITLNPLAEYEYDIEIVTNLDRRKTVEKGIIKPVQDVTRL